VPLGTLSESDGFFGSENTFVDEELDEEVGVARSGLRRVSGSSDHGDAENNADNRAR
jgi:hypothetical protein